MQIVCLQFSQSVMPHICCNTIWHGMTDPPSAFCLRNHLWFCKDRCLPTMLFVLCVGGQAPNRFFFIKTISNTHSYNAPLSPKSTNLLHMCTLTVGLLPVPSMCPNSETHFMWDIQARINFSIDNDSEYIKSVGSVMCVHRD